MTSTPVMDVSFGTVETIATSARSAINGGFQEIWNSRTVSDTEQNINDDGGQPMKKAPGESWKARDEHRARTEKREPIRNAEERADVPEEKPEETAEAIMAAAAEMIQQVADTMQVDTGEVTGKLEELGMEQTDVLNPQNLSKLILQIAGAEDASVLITDETLYGSYQQIMSQLQNVLHESAGLLEQTPEQMSKLPEQLGETEPSEQPLDASESNVPQTPTIVVETSETAADEEVAQEKRTQTAETKNEDIPEISDGAGQKKDAEVNGKTTDTKNSGDSPKDGGENGNQMLQQNLSAKPTETQIQQAAPTERAWSANTENIMRQIMDYMKINLKPEMSSMEMQLHPASLGTLQVQVTSKGGVLTANFITQNEAVKAALESQMIQLKNQFEEQGVRVEAIEVTVQTHEFERNLDQGRGNNSQGQEPSRRGRVRRLNLNDSMTAEEPEEEDMLAKDMMEANGNTVDYSV